MRSNQLLRLECNFQVTQVVHAEEYNDEAMEQVKRTLQCYDFPSDIYKMKNTYYLLATKQQTRKTKSFLSLLKSDYDISECDGNCKLCLGPDEFKKLIEFTDKLRTPESGGKPVNMTTPDDLSKLCPQLNTKHIANTELAKLLLHSPPSPNDSGMIEQCIKGDDPPKSPTDVSYQSTDIVIFFTSL